MSNHPHRRRAPGRRPTTPRLPWRIAGVVGDPSKCEAPGCRHDHPTDPDHVDFAYTYGLHQLGLPELHCSTRSLDGGTVSIPDIAYR